MLFEETIIGKLYFAFKHVAKQAFKHVAEQPWQKQSQTGRDGRYWNPTTIEKTNFDLGWGGGFVIFGGRGSKRRYDNQDQPTVSRVVAGRPAFSWVQVPVLSIDVWKATCWSWRTSSCFDFHKYSYWWIKQQPYLEGFNAMPIDPWCCLSYLQGSPAIELIIARIACDESVLQFPALEYAFFGA